MVRSGSRVALVLLLLLSTLTVADTPQLIGPPGGHIRDLVPDRLHPNVWYSLVFGDIYRSRNYGRSWEKLSLSSPSSILVHPVKSEVYVVSYSQENAEWSIFASSDQGQSFEVRGPARGELRADPRLDKGLYGFADHTVLHSADGGRSWLEQTVRLSVTKVLGCSTRYLAIDDLLPSPHSSQELYVSAHIYHCGQKYPVMLLRSTNHGGTWILEESREKGELRFVWDAAFPREALAFYSATNELVDLSATGWRSLGKPPTEQANILYSLKDVEIVPGRPNELLAVQDLEYEYYSVNLLLKRRLLHSQDRGETWRERDPLLAHTMTLIKAVDDPQRGFLAGTYEGGMYYKPISSDWLPRNQGLPLLGIDMVLAGGSVIYAFPERDRRHLYYRSDDAGRNWKDLSLSRPPGHIEAAAVNPRDGKNVLTISTEYRRSQSREYYLTSLFVSQDGGESWQRAFEQIGSFRIDRDSIVFDPGDTRVVYFWFGTEIYKSLEGGFQPKRLPLKFEYYPDRLLVDEHDSRMLYFATNDGVYKSTDAGQTLQKISKGLAHPYEDSRAEDLAPLQRRGSLLAINGMSQVFETTNAGKLWKRISGLPIYTVGGGDRVGGGRLFAADQTGQRFYCITARNELYQSIDGARNWDALLQGERVPVSDMTDPRRHPFFIATYLGIFKIP